MTFTSGGQLLHYRLLDRIGEGGMGVVWRAVDTTLDREVAIKILPPALSVDADRIARFEREAKLLASLSHPNIAALHSVHRHDDVRFLAMELVAGEDLQQVLRRGPLPVDEAIDVARQVALALEAAHGRGVVHRDLKPANVKVTDGGAVKVLDFGLAKALDPIDAPSGPGASGSGPANADPTGLSDRPTMTSPAMTEAGMILGTAAYMSPEQARGKPVDARTDIWAFGCFLFELLTGRHAFDGPTVTDTLAAIVRSEPDWTLLPEATPPNVRRLLRRCLQKDPRKRLQHAGDARLELEEAADESEATATPSPASAGGARRSLVLPAVMLLAGLVAGALGARAFLDRGVATAGPSRQLDLALDYPLDTSGVPRRKLALSPDGHLLAFVARTIEGSEIRLRDLTRDTPSVAVPGSVGGHSPFFSPDGRWIGFFAQGQLRKAPVEGSGAVALVPTQGGGYGGTWSADGTIVFGSAGGLIQWVSSDGGMATPLDVGGTDTSATSFIWPHFIPGTRTVLLTTLTDFGGERGPIIIAVSLDTGEYHIVTRGVDGQVLPGGYLLYQLDNAALVAPFDVDRLEVSGPAIPLSTPIAIDNVGAVTAAVSDDGLLVFEPPGTQRENRLLWVDCTGSTTPITDEVRPFALPRLSPTGDRLAWGGLISETFGDIWVLDLARASTSRVTFESLNAYPAWMPDGRQVAFSSLRSGAAYMIFIKGIDDDSAPRRLGTREITSVPCSFSPDGSVLLYYEVNPATQRDIWAQPMDGADAVPLVVTEHNERAPEFSPDGRWFAYVSDESGVDEIYVRAYPVTASRWKVSTDGGREPAWNPSGGELFYRKADAMVAVPFTVSADGASFEAGRPAVLFRGSYLFDTFSNANYAVDRDGRRFAMVQGPDPGPGRLRVITNWFDELGRLVAGSGAPER